jgi:hypothetical protein
MLQECRAKGVWVGYSPRIWPLQRLMTFPRCKGYLGISIGPAELVFSVPLSTLVPLGQSLMTIGAPENVPPS